LKHITYKQSSGKRRMGGGVWHEFERSLTGKSTTLAEEEEEEENMDKGRIMQGRGRNRNRKRKRVKASRSGRSSRCIDLGGGGRWTRRGRRQGAELEES
jgi:hypothetical protein